jgi:hypothetical protein
MTTSNLTTALLRWFPIEDPEHVDERRAAVGLSPLAEYAATMNSRDSADRDSADSRS